MCKFFPPLSPVTFPTTRDAELAVDPAAGGPQSVIFLLQKHMMPPIPLSFAELIAHVL